jgi:S1-C subfamily serine protease
MIIVRLGGVPVRGSDDVVRLLGNDRIGAETPVTVIAGGELRTITIVPVER